MAGGRERRAIPIAFGLVLVLGISVAGQSPYPQFPSTSNGKLGRNYPDTNSQFGAEPTPDPKRMRVLNAERQKELVSDTQKLLQLARELNAEVSDANAAAMSDAQLRKVAEIAKLARSIKEKMTYSVGGYPSLKGPPTFDNQ
jgi:hypothetical protein